MPEAISEKIVEGLPVPEAGNKVHFFSGTILQGKKAPAGFGVRVTAGGTKSFVLFHRVDGRKYLETLGRWDANAQGGTLTVRDAIIRADKLAKDLRNGRREDPRPERTRRLQDVGKATDGNVSGLLDTYVARYLKAGKLRSAGMIEAQLERLVKPKIGKLGIYELKRSHISRMLDDIADENGPRMADLVLAYVRKAFNWYEVNGHDDDFISPVVRGMARLKPSDRERERVLSDDEIRDVWAALDTITEPACFPAYVRTLLLTATRRSESADMSTTELEGDLWTIPKERYKTGRDHVIPLSTPALDLIRAQAPAKPSKNAHFVFSTTDGAIAFSGFSKAKRELDKAIANIREREERPPMEDWTLHDLRRIARTLLARAGVRDDIAERCLGHVIKGVEKVYNRYAYLEEKRAAFEALAALVSRILSPHDAVVALRSA
ncbi:MAG: tyrosine-type recombinase/integrase [Xanthobacteraceae bacterium]